MGPEPLAAQLFRPVELDRAPFARFLSREASSGFQSFLSAAEDVDVAPTAREDRRSEASDGVDENEDLRETESDDDSPEPDAAGEGESADDSAPVVPIEVPTPQVAAPDAESQEAPANQEPSALPDAPQRPSVPLIPTRPALLKTNDHLVSPTVEPQPAAGELESGRALGTQGASPQGEKPQPAPAPSVSKARTESALPALASGKRTVEPAAEGHRRLPERPLSATSPSDQNAPQQRPDRPERSPSLPPAQPSEATREEAPRQNPAAETVFERKLRQSVEQRREASSDGSTGGRQNGKVTAFGRAGAAERGPFASPAHGLGSALALKSPSLRSGHGDSASAAIARFLVVGSGGSETPALGRDAFGGAPASASTSAVVGNASSVISTPISQFGATGLGATPIAELLATNPGGSERIDVAARVLSASGAGGRFNVTMQLEPPELGMLRVQVRMSQQGMTLNVDTQSAEVARLVESRLSELRDALASHGIRIDRADVVARAPDPGAGGGQANLQQQSGQEPGADGRPAQDSTYADAHRDSAASDGQAADFGGSAAREDEQSDPLDGMIAGGSAEGEESADIAEGMATHGAPGWRRVVDLVA